MPAPIKAITAAFNHAVRQEPFFRHWRKRGVRKFWDATGALHRGIELTLFKHSWESNQVVGVAVLFGYPTTVQPLSTGFGGESDGTNFIVATYASPTEGMGVPTFASDRAMHLREEADVEQFRLQLPELFCRVVTPFSREHSEERAFFEWYFGQHRMPSSLPLVLARDGPAAARRALAHWLVRCEEERGGDRLVEWLNPTGCSPPRCSSVSDWPTCRHAPTTAPR